MEIARNNIKNGLNLIKQLEKEVEIWLPIEGYNNKYFVSSFGRIKNMESNKVLKLSTSANAYKIVNLSKADQFKRHYVHRLVCKAFFTNPLNKLYIDHKDNDKSNNHIHNLRWATASENGMNMSLQKRSSTGVKGVTYYKRSKKYLASIMINSKRCHIGYFESIEDAKKARNEKAKLLYKEFRNSCEK
jgi:hypothetical protein